MILIILMNKVKTYIEERKTERFGNNPWGTQKVSFIDRVSKNN